MAGREAAPPLDSCWDRSALGLPIYKKWTEAEASEALRLIQGGASHREVAARFQVPRSSITAVVARMKHGRPIGRQPRPQA